MIITDYINENCLNLDVDGLIINSYEYSITGVKTFKSYELDSIISRIKKNKLKVFLNVNKVISCFEVEEFKNYLLKYVLEVDYIIYSDYSVLEIISDYDLLIYANNSLVTSSSEVSVLKTKTFLANEINYEQIKKIVLDNPLKVCLNVFGYQQIMYSKRNILSMYSEFKKIKLSKNYIYNLKEELRDGFFKVIETDNGFLVYTNYIYAFSKDLFELIDKLFLIKIDSFNIDSCELSKICSSYKNKIELKEKDYSRGFLELKSKLKND